MGSRVDEVAHEWTDGLRVIQRYRLRLGISCALASAWLAVACSDDGSEGSSPADVSAAAGTGQTAGGAGNAADADGSAGSQAGASGRRSALSCPPRPEEPVLCGGQQCPHETEYESNSCFVACCMQVDGEERCGLRGTSRAFNTECVAPAAPDPSCDEVPQFQGCCNMAEHKCGIIGGFSPGCTLQSSFVTLPENPKACGLDSEDAGTSEGDAAPPAAGSGDAPAPDAAAGDAAAAAKFELTPVGFPMAGAELTFPESANPPTNESPEFTWTGVPAGSKSLALAFRDLGNGAVKWIIWDIPPTVTHLPPNVSPVAMPSEVPGSSQLGSLDNQGYAGPGSGARQYDFTLWALDVDKLPVTARQTTVQIHDEVMTMHQLAKTAPVLVRNTRNQR